MSLLDKLKDEETWKDFFDYKKEKGHLTKRETAALLDFISQKRYIPLAEKIAAEGFCFSPPTKKLVNKIGTAKKRVVYSFSYEETFILKLIANLLYVYDNYFSPNCYSFRKNTGVKRAVSALKSTKNISGQYCYKLDIKNYFNSVDTSLLLPLLKEIFSDDAGLYGFFKGMLMQDGCVFEGRLIKEERGVMAGTPTSPFLSNVFLTSLDRYFFEQNVPYARYSDDIIVFAPTEEKLNEYRGYIHNVLSSRNLVVNADKEQIIAPGQPWPFLGIEYSNGEIDLSPATVKKIKDKIRRKARALYRWKNKKSVSYEKALIAMTKRFNKKFFLSADPDDLNWSRWFFPLITTGKRLKEVDEYMQENLRFLATGKHNKANYEKVPYEKLKSCGYISLVNKYYKYIDKTETD